jgi:hypothetical protein
VDFLASFGLIFGLAGSAGKASAGKTAFAGGAVAASSAFPAVSSAFPPVTAGNAELAAESGGCTDGDFDSASSIFDGDCSGNDALVLETGTACHGLSQARTPTVIASAINTIHVDARLQTEDPASDVATGTDCACMLGTEPSLRSDSAFLSASRI